MTDPTSSRLDQLLSAFKSIPFIKRNEKHHRFVPLADRQVSSSDITAKETAEPIGSSNSVSIPQNESTMVASSQTVITTQRPRTTSDVTLIDMNVEAAGNIINAQSKPSPLSHDYESHLRVHPSHTNDQSLYHPNPTNSLHHSLFRIRTTASNAPPYASANSVTDHDSASSSMQAEDGRIVSSADLAKLDPKPNDPIDSALVSGLHPPSFHHLPSSNSEADPLRLSNGRFSSWSSVPSYHTNA
ncbi:hypothetical protein K435DRAFT_55331 [Dendrothele bispora CBS 962.96]|uniref:Uncharacterized protein n=1 Tax=Dendrothele bispora (strain CBS 962.96) TaxID=1314807 RepID=A0A4V4HBT5_DENBC|nr:hypothetical protein K435DRAFT_497052 [Dendrothele bispora CBS 962.96]THU97788.1 hypothetical protein K435DRAFT_55331 [Dendrothele bispora CBS 962.96]